MKTLGKIVFTLLITGVWWEADLWLLMLMNQPYTIAVFGALVGLVCVSFLWWWLLDKTWSVTAKSKEGIERLKKYYEEL